MRRPARLSPTARPTPPPARGALASSALVLTAVASVQFGATIASGLFASVGPAGAVLMRVGFAAVMLLVLFRPDPRRYRPRDLGLAAVFGLALGGMNLSFYSALDRIPLGVAVTLEFVGPLGVAVVGSRRRLDFLWVALAAGGILLLARGGTEIDVVGAGFALLAGSLWAAYIVLGARLGQVFPRGDGLAMGLVVATVLLVPVGLVSGGGELLRPRSLVLGVALAVLSSALPYSLELEALRTLPTAVFGVLMSTEPAMAALAGFLVLDQRPTPRVLGAIVLVVAASAGALSQSGRQERVAGGQVDPLPS